LMMQEVPRIAVGYPYFLLGEFNYEQNSAPYPEVKTSPDLVDTYSIAARRINGDQGTLLSGFNPNSTGTGRIDRSFAKKQNSRTIVRHQIITGSVDGKAPSDHRPVLGAVEF